VSFERFTRAGLKNKKPRIYLKKDGKIYTNRACKEKYLNNLEFAVLYFDREHRAMGISPKAKRSDDTLKITYCKNNACVISSRRFFDVFDIPYGNNYEPVWERNITGIIIELKEHPND
jgi:hypothetical protein